MSVVGRGISQVVAIVHATGDVNLESEQTKGLEKKMQIFDSSWAYVDGHLRLELLWSLARRP